MGRLYFKFLLTAFFCIFAGGAYSEVVDGNKMSLLSLPTYWRCVGIICCAVCAKDLIDVLTLHPAEESALLGQNKPASLFWPQTLLMTCVPYLACAGAGVVVRWSGVVLPDDGWALYLVSLAGALVLNMYRLESAAFLEAAAEAVLGVCSAANWEQFSVAKAWENFRQAVWSPSGRLYVALAAGAYCFTTFFAAIAHMAGREHSPAWWPLYVVAAACALFLDVCEEEQTRHLGREYIDLKFWARYFEAKPLRGVRFVFQVIAGLVWASWIYCIFKLSWGEFILYVLVGAVAQFMAGVTGRMIKRLEKEMLGEDEDDDEDDDDDEEDDEDEEDDDDDDDDL